MEDERKAVGTSTDVVVKEIRIDARPETVFEFFTDPEKMTRWKASPRISTPGPAAYTAST